MKLQKELAEETLINVGSSLAVNYPLSVLVTWIIMSAFGVTNPVIIATVVSIVLTLVGLARVYYIRYRFQSRSTRPKTDLK